MAGNLRNPGESVAARLLAILASFDEQHRELTLSEISRRSDVSLPTAHRLVKELAQWGALNRRANGSYVIGRRLWDLGLLAPVQSGLRQLASPFLHDLYSATRATVHLAIRDKCEALYVDRLRGHASVPVVSQVGSRLPLYATGVGKVLLAHAPEPVTREVLTDLKRITPYTIVQPGTMAKQLVKVRHDGYAVTQEEMSLGASSVAVPIRNREDHVVAALGIVVPQLKRNRSQLVAALQVAAQGISRSLPS